MLLRRTLIDAERAGFVEWRAMFVEPLFMLLAGFATAAFVSAAFLSFIRNDPSSLFFTLAAGATSSLFFVHLPRNPLELVLICVLTGIADVACAAPKTRKR